MFFDFDAIRSALVRNQVNSVEFYRQGKVVKRSFPQIYADVVATIELLSAKGLKPGDRVGILGGNSYEWLLTDLACLARSWISVAFHNNGAETHVPTMFNRYSLQLLVTTEQYLPDIPPQKKVMLFAELQKHVETTTVLKELQKQSSQMLTETITIYFTSGTTGTPKPIGFSRRACGDYLDHVRELFPFVPDDKIILFLPFSALLERLHIYTAIIVGFNILIVPIENLAKSLRADQPTILVGVPYLFENIYSAFRQRLNANLWQKNLFALYTRLRPLLPGWLNRRLQSILFREVHAFWGGRIRLMLSGTAPIKREVLDFHETVNLPILEGYGISEIGMVTVNTPGQYRIFSVGRPFPGCQVVIDESNQILVKSPHFFSSGYLEANCPEQQRFRADGFYETGDMGYLDEDGFLFINGRLKEIIVLSNGKKAHPLMIEEKLSIIGGICQVAVFGDGRAYLVCVLVKNGETNEESIRMELARVNHKLPPFMQIKNALITNEAFTVDNRGLTATMKLNRPAIWKKFRDQLELFYVNP